MQRTDRHVRPSGAAPASPRLPVLGTAHWPPSAPARCRRSSRGCQRGCPVDRCIVYSRVAAIFSAAVRDVVSRRARAWVSRCRAAPGSRWSRCPPRAYTDWWGHCPPAIAHWWSSPPHPACGRASPSASTRSRRLPSSQVHVEQQLVTIGGQEPRLGPPKTEASRRVVPLPQIVLDALARTWQHTSLVSGGCCSTTANGGALAFDLVADVDCRSTRGRAAGRHRLPCATPLLRKLAPRHGESVSCAGAARARKRRGDAGHLTATCGLTPRTKPGRGRRRARRWCAPGVPPSQHRHVKPQLRAGALAVLSGSW
jgi:hypothetical protein